MSNKFNWTKNWVASDLKIVAIFLPLFSRVNFFKFNGGVAEWLGSRLQICVRGFDFLHHLHLNPGVSLG